MSTIDKLPDDLADILGQAIANERKQFRAQFAEAKAACMEEIADLQSKCAAFSSIIGELEAQVTDLSLKAQALVGPAGKDGEDGKEGPPGKDGKDGAPGRDGLPGIPGRDGKDGRGIDEIALGIGTGEGEKWAPVGCDGKDGKDGKDGAPGRDGLPGVPGRDGATGLNGKDGFGFEDVTVDYDGERSFRISFERGNDAKVFGPFVLPLVIDRGVFKDDKAYEAWDAVTCGGSLWIAQASAPQGKPGLSPDWRLSVKKGRDGKDGKDGAKGERGEKGAPGSYKGID